MILVILGSQDKKFYRLLKAISEQIEKKVINEEVIVQAGYSADYQDNRMKIYDYISREEINKLEKKAKYIICHAGVGTILECLKLGKKLIVAPRLKKYKEHTNDHQLQILNEFYSKGYILKLDDFNKLDKEIKKIKKFQPKKYISNNLKFVKLIDDIINSF